MLSISSAKGGEEEGFFPRLSPPPSIQEDLHNPFGVLTLLKGTIEEQLGIPDV